MKEALLHYLWKFRKLGANTLSTPLVTTSGEIIAIINTGIHNHQSGPDFFSAQLRIGEQLWAGNVEIHIKSSDWYLHNHENDAAYSNVILHVVWEEDCEVFNRSNQAIPTLTLKDRIDPALLINYQRLLEAKSYNFINCEKQFAEVDTIIINNWLERIYFERLERKVIGVDHLLKVKKGDWEAVLFTMLARNFGTVINADAFEELAEALPIKTIRKLTQSSGELEAVFFGLCGFLNETEHLDSQTQSWKEAYAYAKAKYNFKPALQHRIEFFKLRPPNFPTIRLSQLARLYEKNESLFSKIISVSNRKEFHKLFNITTSEYWSTHYNFNKLHKKRVKKLTTSFIDLLLINTLLPLKFAYARAKGITTEDDLLKLVRSIPSEKNTIVTGFQELQNFKNDALHSQAFIELKKNYCNKNRCLSCQTGNSILNKT